MKKNVYQSLLLALFIFFLGQNQIFSQAPPTCTADISADTNFTIGQQYATPINSGIAVYNTPVAADLDNNGTVELVVMANDNITANSGRSTKNLRVFDGLTGNLVRTIVTPYLGWSNGSPLGVADVDGDGKGEIFVVSSGNAINPVADRRYIYCYEDDGTLKWKSDTQVGYSDAFYGSSLNFADFNQDGIPEVYLFNQVYNASTGVKLAEGGVLNNKGMAISTTTGNTANSFAADILPSSSGLELVAGNQVYAVNITNPLGTAGNSMSVAVTGQNQPQDGFSNVADMDLDGDLDIVTAYVINTNQVMLQVWDGQTSNLVAPIAVADPSSAVAFLGIPTIGDIDGDCEPEILLVTSHLLTAFEMAGGNIVSKWSLATSDNSGATGQTLFDFNQDGRVEIVYRDQSHLRIISGNTGQNIATFPCTSSTGWENPIVVDVDGDSQAEIVVTCGAASGFNGVLEVYGTASTPWAPAREIWNQKTYQPVAVNDDLSIPVIQENHANALSTTSCGCNGSNRPFNNFIVQSTQLDAQGCPFTPVPDATIELNSMLCNLVHDSIVVQFTVSNSGSAQFPANAPITLYGSDPVNSGAIALATTTLPMATDTGQSQSFSITIDTTGLLLPATFYIVVNDDASLPTPYSLALDFPVTGIVECDYLNNLDSVYFEGCGPDYCEAAGLNSSYEWIESVSFATVNNTSGNNGGYANFAGMNAMVTGGSNLNLSLTPGFSAQVYTEFWEVLVDWNGDGDFWDSGELIFQGSGTSTVNASIAIPTNAASGPLRMRILMGWNSSALCFCGHFSYGEVEDYSLIVTGPSNNLIGRGETIGRGGFEISPQTFTRTTAPGIQISRIFPNPIGKSDLKNLKVQFRVGDIDQVDIRLMNTLGKVVLVKSIQVEEGENECRLNVNDLPTGIYLLEVNSGESKWTQKLLIQ